MSLACDESTVTSVTKRKGNTGLVQLAYAQSADEPLNYHLHGSGDYDIHSIRSEDALALTLPSLVPTSTRH